MNQSEKRLPPSRVAALHDLSCMGRCALTVILPVLSAMGFQPVPVPTALLSTHTGGYTGLHLRDLTPDMEAITDHFEKINVRFRAIYTGFLGSAEQVRAVSAFLDTFGELPDESGKKPLILVDPVMGDDGELYSTYTPELADAIRKISSRADLLTPNLTEAALLTKTPYLDTALVPEAEALSYAKALSERLKERYPRAACVITGIVLREGRVVNLGYDKGGSPVEVSHPLCARSYPGTGDVFASVLLGKLLGGAKLAEAVSAAAEFVRTVTERSCLVDYETRAGLSFEPELFRLFPNQ